MKVVDPGHVYDLDWLDSEPEWIGHFKYGQPENRLVFVKREGDGYPGNVGHHAGTNIQEVLRALIDRVKYLDGQIYDHNNADVLAGLRKSLYCLERRAATRHGRALDPAMNVGEIEILPTCQKCGHIGCAGECHP